MGYRCDSEGIPDENGTYIKVKFEHSIADNIPGNDWTNRVHYKSASSSTWIDAGSYASARGRVIGNGDISTNSTYNVRYTLSDKFETVTKIFDVAPSFVTIDFKRGGKGIAIGKISEADNLFEVAVNTKITKSLQVNGNLNVSKGNQNPETGRTSERGQLYTYNTTNANTGAPTTYTSVVGFGRGTAGTVEICGEWTSGRGLWFRALRDTTDNWYGWERIYTTAYKPSWGDIQSKPDFITKNEDFWLYRDGRHNFVFHNSSKNNGTLVIAPSTSVGGWDVNWNNEYNFTPSGTFDAKWVKGRDGIEGWTTHTRYLKNYSGNNIDVITNGHALALNCGSASGIYVDFRPQWSGSKGTEPSFFNTSGNGWGFIGGSGHSWFRVHGLGGSVSDRNKKYDITKADCEEQYENVKSINIYNYRTISDKVNKETGEIEEKIYRQDLMLGCMVDELPTETVFYDNESGDGKAVDMYSYTSMILGATKHLQTKVENLEKENDLKDRKIDKLESRLEKLEELLDGIINKG